MTDVLELALSCFRLDERSAYKAKLAQGEEASLKEAAAEAIYLLQELLNIRLAYELERRGLIEIPKFDVKLH
jgi:hypothetical protein